MTEHISQEESLRLLNSLREIIIWQFGEEGLGDLLNVNLSLHSLCLRYNVPPEVVRVLRVGGES